MITGSKLELAVYCLHSFTLKLPYEKPGPQAQWGTEFHAAAAKSLSIGFPVAPPHLTQAIDTWWQETRHIWPRGVETEIALSWSPQAKAARFLGYDIGRNYVQSGAKWDDVCLSLDVGWSEADRVVIVDHKTGRRYHGVNESWQLRGGAAVYSAVKNRPHATVAYHYISPTGLVTPEEAQVTRDELADARETLTRVGLDLMHKNTAPRAGDHCDRLYCRARPMCDAYKMTHAKKENSMSTRMSLKNVERGRQETPLCVLLFGPEGIGKSTFASGSPDPIFISERDGTSHLDVARFPVPQDWPDVLSALDVLANESHEYKSVVVDTVDWVEPMCWAYLCKASGKKTIEDFGYGKGYSLALDEFRGFLSKLDVLRDRKRMNVVLLAHSHVKTFKNPAGDDYDNFELRVHSKVAEVLRAWPNAVLFGNYRTYTVGTEADKKAGRVKAVGDGSRVVYTEARPAWHAKNRYGLPPEMPLSWGEFERHARMGEPAASAEIEREIQSLLSQADNETRAAATESLERNRGRSRELSVLLDWVKGTVNLKAEKAA